MPTDLELEKDADWFEQILEQGPRAETYDTGAHVCQVCGELMFFTSEEQRLAALSETSEFVGFGPQHVHCSGPPAPHLLACRRYRYCEVCRGSVFALPSSRSGHFWLCLMCEGRIGKAEFTIGSVLRDLAFRRSTIRDRLKRREPAPPLKLGFEQSLHRVVQPLPGWLPPGLRVCEDCGAIRGKALSPRGDGEVGHLKSTCLCEGLICKICNRRRVPRPISNRYDTIKGGWWHAPHFMGWAPCGSCRENAKDGAE